MSPSPPVPTGSSDSADHRRLGDLIRKMLDEQLSPADYSELTELLQSSSEAKQIYLDAIEVDTELRAHWGTPIPGNSPLQSRPQNITPPKSGSPESGTSSKRFLFQLLAIAAVFALGAGSAWIPHFLSPPDQSDSRGTMIDGESQSEKRVVQSDPGGEQDATRSTFLPDSGEKTTGAAVVVRSENVDAESLEPGRRLGPGEIRLASGTLQLEFMCGAIVAIEGPARFNIKSRDLATLLSGSVSAHVPERARGFILNGPNTAVVDLGTEFSLHVDETGTSEVSVNSGEVELSLVDEDGRSLISRRIGEATRIRVNRDERTLVPVPSPQPMTSPEIILGHQTPLRVPEQYVTAVQAKQPILHWRFESPPEGGLLPNAMGESHRARVFHEGAEERGIAVVDGQLHFDRTAAGRYLVSQEPIEQFNQSAYSFEFWIRPDDLQHATCVGVVPMPNHSPFAHLNVVEIITDSFLIHEPGAFRLLHRVPPSGRGGQDTNLISSGICQPGVWQHVVATKDSNRLELYVQGELVKRVDVEGLNCEGDFQIMLGQLKPRTTERQFSGAMDEFAVYPRQLSGDEIRNHFQLMMNAN